MNMGLVYTEITLKNAIDAGKAREGLINESEVRQVRVNAMADSGAGTLVINETIFQKLGLAIKRIGEVTVAGGGREPCKITEPVSVRWKDRETDCNAVVLPGEAETLLGAIPLEGLDLMVNPVERVVVGAHGDKIVCMVK
jgi:clan AA aspartic protease